MKRRGFLSRLIRRRIGCEIANILIYKLPAIPSKNLDEMAIYYIGYFNECDIFLSWNKKEGRFE